LSEHLVQPLAQPVEAPALHRFGQPRPDDQDVVTAARDPLEPGTPELPQLPLDPVADNGAADPFRHREPEPGRALLLAREPVENEVAGRDGAAVPVDGVEVARPGETVAPLHGIDRAQAE